LLIPTGIDLTVQGGVSFEGALNVVGNFSVATNKFTVAAASLATRRLRVRLRLVALARLRLRLQRH
jgi:hypothetical protein